MPPIRSAVEKPACTAPLLYKSPWTHVHVAFKRRGAAWGLEERASEAVVPLSEPKAKFIYIYTSQKEIYRRGPCTPKAGGLKQGEQEKRGRWFVRMCGVSAVPPHLPLLRRRRRLGSLVRSFCGVTFFSVLSERYSAPHHTTPLSLACTASVLLFSLVVCESVAFSFGC